jgi:hypothetical protein
MDKLPYNTGVKNLAEKADKLYLLALEFVKKKSISRGYSF